MSCDIEAILREYDCQIKDNQSYLISMHTLIERLLEESGIQVHVVTHRLKTRKSLEKKIQADNVKIEKYEDITDINGIRVITLFADDVDKISELVEKEFQIDTEHSIDKRKQIEPDRFGYLSMHYILNLDATRLKHKEYSKFSGFKAELQIRSILQHAWAEIEHDLGYKSEDGLPREERRTFSMLAGILELSDKQFINLRESLKSHKENVEESVKRNELDIPIDEASLLAFINASELVSKIDEAIRLNLKWEKRDIPVNPSVIKMLKFVNINNIKDLNGALLKYEEKIAEFAYKFMISTVAKAGLGAKGMCIFNLALLLAGRSLSTDFMKRFMIDTNLFDGIQEGHQNALLVEWTNTNESLNIH